MCILLQIFYLIAHKFLSCEKILTSGWNRWEIQYVVRCVCVCSCIEDPVFFGKSLVHGFAQQSFCCSRLQM